MAQSQAVPEPHQSCTDNVDFSVAISELLSVAIKEGDVLGAIYDQVIYIN
jgi:hypothetical protein